MAQDEPYLWSILILERKTAMPRTHSAKTAVSRKPGASHSWLAHVPAAPHTPTVQVTSVPLAAEPGLSKAEASALSATSPARRRSRGKIRAKLIPDSSWKRAGKRLGPQASQTTARLRRVLGARNPGLG